MIGARKPRSGLPALAWYAWLWLVTAGCLIIPPDLIQGGGGGGGGGVTSDGDRISTAVEKNEANSYLNFDTLRNDPDPSIARLLPSTGTLVKGINLPDNHASYYHYLGSYQGIPDPVDSDDWGTLTLVNVGEGTARDWGDANRECFVRTQQHPTRFGIGDLSKGNKVTQQFGGTFLPHSWHKNGLDMDVRYMRKDPGPNGETGLNLKSSPADHDTLATADLLGCFLGFSEVTKILVDMRHVGLDFTGFPTFIHDTNHFDHFHVQIADPDGTNN
jgi:hypothetical protein